NRLACRSGRGPERIPAYALRRSVGTDEPTGAITSVPGRSLRATYTLQIANQNTAGGLVHAYRTATGTDLCLDAGSASPAAGTAVRMQPCSTGSGQQRFAYNANLTLVLVASRTAALPLDMCLDAGTPQAVGRIVLFQQCAGTTVPQQQWIANGSANLEGTADGLTPDGYCFNVQSPDTAGSYVVLGSAGTSTCRGGYSSVQ